MRTRATYDVVTKSFIFHTPDFEAAKCWVGNLGELSLLLDNKLMTKIMILDELNAFYMF
jgi:hypothetical protein